IPLVTEKDDPLLAHWQHGVGKSVAFTSDAKERWGTNWMGWEKYSKFWAQIVRWSLRSPFNQNYQVETSVDGSHGKIMIDAVNTKGEFRNFVDIKGRIVSPTLEAQDVTFRQVSAGRYEAEFNAQEPGTYMFSAQAKSESGQGNDLVTGGTSLSYSPEFQSPKSNELLLYHLAEVTQGRILGETDPIFLHNLASRSEPQSLWPILLTTALILFLFDVFVRRVLIGWAEIASGAAIAWNWARTKYGWRRMGQAGETATGKLLKVKDTVRAAEPASPTQREDFLASLKQVKTESSAVTEAMKKTGAPPPATGPKPPPKPAGKGEGQKDSEGGGHTSQLLKAREEARKKFNKPN
ncbi:hypothetical protein HYR69_08325, partial [Candidatus Sumerlaeota bacterium]|nr:hypothetical protein [Candidatus Sumerlaeota bacterium]